MTLLDSLPILLLGLVLFEIKPVKPILSGFNEDYLSIKSGKSLRGILALVIVLHHLTVHIEPDGLGMFFKHFANIGFLAVAVFFFVSGYGLQKQYLKNENYKNGFLLKRLPTVLFPYILTNVFWFVCLNCTGNKTSVLDMLKGLVNGSPVVAHSWYVLSILVFYVVFWLLMLVCKKRYWLMLVGGLIYYALCIVFCLKMNYGAWWFNTPYLLIVGMFWAIYEEKILKFLKKHYYLSAFTVFAIFLIVFVLLTKANSLSEFPIKSIVSALFFVMFLLFGLLKFRIGNPVLEYLGGISFELYLIHEIFLTIFKTVFVIENNLVYAITAIVSSIIFAQLFAWLNKFILSSYKKLVLRNK